jgi:hypothetical protein
MRGEIYSCGIQEGWTLDSLKGGSRTMLEMLHYMWWPSLGWIGDILVLEPEMGRLEIDPGALAWNLSVLAESLDAHPMDLNVLA